MLDLEAGVDLQEEELAAGVVDQELDRPGRPVADPVGQLQGSRPHGVSAVGTEHGSR